MILKEVMNLLVFSDLHDDEFALESILRLAPKYDYAFGCGDLSRSTLFAEQLLLPNLFLVPGNWDNEAVGLFLSNTRHWLHCKRIELGNGLNAVGFGYTCPTPYGTFGELDESEIYEQMNDLPIDHNSLLFMHCPPYGKLDLGRKHLGSKSILRIIEEKKPFAAFFGHVHEVVGSEMFGSTKLVKLPPANEMAACSVSISNKNLNVEYISL